MLVLHAVFCHACDTETDISANTNIWNNNITVIDAYEFQLTPQPLPVKSFDDKFLCWLS